MILSTHQPLFLPWPGLFFKAMKSDCMVLLDAVQFPRGRSWMSRNRLKSEQGAQWLTVPIQRKGRGIQQMQDVEIQWEQDWVKKHLRSLYHWYSNAPFLNDYLSELTEICNRRHSSLLKLNLDLIRFFWRAVGLETELFLQSEIGITGSGTGLIVDICRHLDATQYLGFPMAAKYLDSRALLEQGIQCKWEPFSPPVYPQLWGDFVPNLSTLDLLFNCGPVSRRILLGNLEI